MPTMPKTTVTKSDFIRSMPAAHAKDVVKAGAAKGIKFAPSFVYAIRAMDKKRNGAPMGKPGRKARGGTPGSKPKANAWRAAGSSGDDLAQFRRLVLTIGLARAEAYLADLKKSVGL